jgi:hypothetical protein
MCVCVFSFCLLVWWYPWQMWVADLPLLGGGETLFSELHAYLLVLGGVICLIMPSLLRASSYIFFTGGVPRLALPFGGAIRLTFPSPLKVLFYEVFPWAAGSGCGGGSEQVDEASVPAPGRTTFQSAT